MTFPQSSEVETQRPTSPLARGPLGWMLGIEDTCVYPRTVDAFAPLDEHVLTGHDRQWRQDIDRAVQLGAQGIRYGMSWPVVHRAPDKFDWSLLDGPLNYAHSCGLHVMADLVHYGCPPWLDGSFVDPGFVDALATFTAALVDRYGDELGSITPVNEPLTTASFCGQRSVWPPALNTDEGWAAVATALAEAAQQVTRVVREAAPHLPVVHVEAGHLYETEDLRLDDQVRLHRMLGDLPTDLALGRCRSGSEGWSWLVAHGISPDRLERLTQDAPLPDILGINYYPDLTPRVLAHGAEGQLLQLTVDRGAAGLARVLRDAASRYGLPLAVTETSIEGSAADRAAWLDAAVDEVHRCREDGLDVRALTWWPMIDFVDWSHIADGASVEEFMTGVVDPATQRLVPVAIPTRDGERGLDDFIRRMGLFDLDGSDTTRTPNTAASRFEQHARGLVPAPLPVVEGRASVQYPPSTVVELDGEWVLRLPGGTTQPVSVPGLWEAQGHPTLDGRADYQRSFGVADPSGWWTLRFGAVMDTGQVSINGVEVGRGDLPYTPWTVDVTNVIRAQNEIEVAVEDPPAGSSAHLGSAHGKQGWANHEFPSPPSLYLTYGGIWQPVTLHRHGQVAIRDVVCDLDPTSPTVRVELEALEATDARGNDVIDADVTVTLGGVVRTARTRLHAGGSAEPTLVFDDVGLPPWNPTDPVLHSCEVVVRIGEQASDEARMDVGLRTVEVDDRGLVLNGEPVRIRSALVQGFHADALYSEGTDEDIEHEVRQAQSLGFNMLRLHLRAFDPRYLTVCDRLGMLLHCDIPVAEPIAHDLIDDVGPLARRAASTATAQVRRDRSHASIVLWSVMNELGLDRAGLRRTDRYERFARHLMAVLATVDESRPAIENDWVEPNTDRVFCAPLATAHWYGHLDNAYLRELASRCEQAGDERLPVLVTELGDWGLPAADSAQGRFYDHRDAYERMLADTWWPGDLDEFAAATERYQGLSDRLQIDVLRRSNAVGGYCVTELTDVPWEFNGILDVNRNVKRHSAEHLKAANSVVSPVLSSGDFACREGVPLEVDAMLVNDQARQLRVRPTVHLGARTVSHPDLVTVAPHSAGPLAHWLVSAPPTTGEAVVRLEVEDVDTGAVWSAEYPVTVHPPTGSHAVAIATADATADELVGALPWLARTDDAALLLVGENALADASETLFDHLEAGGTAIVLAQGADGPDHPAARHLETIRAEWGGTPFRYTTDAPVVRAFPPRSVLDVHDADIAPDTIVVPSSEPTHVAVGVFKPLPRPAAGLVVGAVPVSSGRVVVCQYRLHERTLAGGATAQAVLEDVVRWASALDDEATSAASAGSRVA